MYSPPGFYTVYVTQTIFSHPTSLCTAGYTLATGNYLLIWWLIHNRWRNISNHTKAHETSRDGICQLPDYEMANPLTIKGNHCPQETLHRPVTGCIYVLSTGVLALQGLCGPEKLEIIHSNNYLLIESFSEFLMFMYIFSEEDVLCTQCFSNLPE